ncbi:lipopolysaccharide transport periplasmic protein LptA [Luteibacter yeojuensis]|nr:lipopolysaccharide transport periplasmic protein LptA [Luteibacter yeojuensis]
MVAVLVAPHVAAKSSDRMAPATVDGSKFSGVIAPNTKSTIDGRVLILQGTLKITGIHADLYSDGTGALKRAVVTGEHAHIEQLDDANALMQGDAESIDYSVDTGIAILTGSARAAKQNSSTVAGDTLRYNTGTGVFDAESTGSALVRVTFQPKASAAAPAPAPSQTAK